MSIATAACVFIAVQSLVPNVISTNCKDVDPTKFALVNFTLWREGGENRSDVIANVRVSVPEGATFYQVMQTAELSDDLFRFHVSWLQSVGYYVYKIGSLRQNPAEKRYWFLYLLPGVPDPENPPGVELLTPKGVGATYVKDGDNFLFWLQTVIWENAVTQDVFLP